MAFKSKLIALTGSDTDVFEFPATYDGGALLFLVNGESSARNVTIKFYKHSTGVTTTLGVFEVTASTAWPFPIKFGLESGDKIIASCASSGVIAYVTVIVGGLTPPGNALTGRGAWNSGATYDVNDIVFHESNSYLALADNTNDEPPSSNWMILAQGGDPGEVTSTGSVTSGRLVSFADGTGDVIQDSGKSIADFATAAQGGKADTAVQPGDVHAASSKSSPVDDDEMSLWDSAASWVLKKWSIANLKTLINGLIATYVATQDVEILKGAIDCSADPNYPAADAGHVYRVSVAGKIGGASGIKVEAGDRLECFVDSTVSGDHATVGANWMVSQVNIDGAVVGPTSGVDGVPPLFDGTSGRLLKSIGTLSDWRSAVGLAIGSAVQAYHASLDAISDLTPSDDDFLQRKGGSWVNRSVSQVITDLIAGNLFANRTIDTPTVNTPTINGATFNNGYTEESYTANTSTALTIDLANGTFQILTLTGNCTYTFPSAAAGKSFTLFQKQDGTGSRTVTWPASVKWPGGTAPTLTSTASKGDLFAFTSDGTNWYGRVIAKNYTP